MFKHAPNADFSKWNDGTHGKRVNDMFDCLKQIKILYDFAKKYLPHSRWRKKMPWFDVIKSPE